MPRHVFLLRSKHKKIGKAQDLYLLFRKRLNSNQSLKNKGILEPKRRFSSESLISVADNIEPHDMPSDVGQSSEPPPGIPDLELSEFETEDSLWNELLYREQLANPTLPLCYQQHQSWRLNKMYQALIILHLHSLIKHLDTARPDFKEQITIYDHDTIGSFHLLTVTLKWVRIVLLEKY